MAWIRYGEILAPVNYHATIYNYNTPRNLSNKEILEEANQIKENLFDIWGDLKGWWISGALNVTLLTQNPLKAHTNTDIIVLDDTFLIKEMCERAKTLSLFPTSRVSSRVPLRANGEFFPEIKEEKYVLADPVKIAKNRLKNRDYMFCKFDQDGRLTQENTPNSRIRLFVHAKNHQEGRYISIEDGLFVPARYIDSTDYPHREGRILAKDSESASSSKRLVLSANIEYMLSIHRETLERLEKSKNRWVNRSHVLKRIEKHTQEINRINAYLATHPNYMRKSSQDKV